MYEPGTEVALTDDHDGTQLGTIGTVVEARGGHLDAAYLIEIEEHPTGSVKAVRQLLVPADLVERA